MDLANATREALLQRIQQLENNVSELKTREQSRERAVEFFEALHQTAIVLMQKTDVEEIMHFIVKRATELAGTEHGFANLLNNEGSLDLRRAANNGLFVNPPMPPPQANQGLIGKVFETVRTQIIDDYNSWDDRRLDWPDHVVYASAGVPFKLNGHCIGVLGLTHDDPAKHFEPETIRAIEALADMGSLAIERAQLVQDFINSRYFAEQITEAVPNIVYVHDLQTQRNIYINSAIHRLLGYTEQEIQDHGSGILAHLIHPEDVVPVVTENDKLRNGDEHTAISVEYRMRHKSGEWRWFRSNDRVFRVSDDGKPVQSVGIAQDITEQKHILEEQRYQAGLLDIIGDAVISVDKDFVIRSWNKGAEKLYDWTENEVIGKPIQTILKSRYAKDDFTDEEIVGKLFAEGQFAGEFITHKRDETPVIIWTVTTIIHGENGELIGSVAVNRDMTDIHRTNAELERNRHFIQSIADTAQVLIYAHDMMSGKNIFLNQYAREFFGEQRSQVVETDGVAFFEDTVHPDDVPEIMESAETWQTIPDDHRVHRRIRMKNKDNEYRWLDMTEVVLKRNEDGSVREIMGTAIDVTDRHQAVEALKMSENRFRAVFENAPMGMALAAANGYTLGSNPALSKFLGYSPAEMQQLHYSKYTHADDLSIEQEKIKQFIEEKVDGYRLEKRYIHRDGHEVWGRLSVNRLQNTGDIVAVAMTENIDEQKQAELALARSEARFRYLTENGSDVVGIIKAGGTFNYLSPSVKRVLGYEPEELLQNPADRLVHIEDHAIFAATLQQATIMQNAVHGPVRYRFLHADGGWRHLEALITHLDVKEETDSYILNIRDITQRVKFEERLRTSEKRFRHLLDTITASVFIYNKGAIRYVNEATCQITGYTRDELISEEFWDIVHKDDRAKLTENIEEARRTGKRFLPWQEVRVHTRDGKLRWLDVRTAEVEISGEMVVIGTALDITERKTAEEREQLVQLERGRVQVLAQFVRDVSHDFRTPLSTMYTSLYMLERVGNDDTRRNHHLKVMENQIAHLERLVEGLFTMARLDGTNTLRMGKLHLNELLNELANKVRVRTEKGFKHIECHLQNDLPYIMGDGVELHRAFMNIVDNAIESTPADGHITLETATNDTHVIVTITDTGIGIDPEDQPRIFERFYRADKARTQGGLGLGLAISHRIVEIHEGTIEVESIPGNGAIFRVLVPALLE